MSDKVAIAVAAHPDDIEYPLPGSDAWAAAAVEGEGGQLAIKYAREFAGVAQCLRDSVDLAP